MVKTNAAKKTVYERSPEEGGKNGEGDRAHKIIWCVTSTDRRKKTVKI